jgi:hypothetical protein
MPAHMYLAPSAAGKTAYVLNLVRDIPENVACPHREQLTHIALSLVLSSVACTEPSRSEGLY